MLQILNLEKEDEELKSPNKETDKNVVLPKLANIHSQNNLSADYINTEENEKNKDPFKPKV